MTTSLLYFCDESHTRGHAFLGVAGIAVQPSRLPAIEADIANLNRRMNYTSEIKWEKARERRDDIFTAYVRLLAELVACKQVHLHLRFSPISQYDHSASGPRGHADTVSKAFYQLLLHRAGRYYSNSCEVHTRPDRGSCTDYLPKIRVGLNTHCRSIFGNRSDCFKTIETRDSEKEPILQLLDVTLGALTCLKNRNHENGTVGPYKASLATRAAEIFDIEDIHRPTSIDTRTLNIWNVVPMIRSDHGPEALSF